jgi:hypothetical protein
LKNGFKLNKTVRISSELPRKSEHLCGFDRR